MGWFEWKYAIKDADKEYDLRILSREAYESRIKYAIYMINKLGNKEYAKKIAKARGYRLEDLINAIDGK